MKTINYDIISDLYDLYVNTQYDVSFYINELKNVKGKILELMCGTGRLSIPLLEHNIELTCIDYSEDMLKVFKNKIKDKGYKVKIVKMDVAELCLCEEYAVIFIPFNSFSEIITEDKQKSVLSKIYKHLSNDGKFICTMYNPQYRVKLADGVLRTLGEYTKEDKTIIVKYLNKYDVYNKTISGYQLYEIYDYKNKLEEKRKMEINFRVVEKNDFEEMLKVVGFKIINIYGNYDYSKYESTNSKYLVYDLKKVV